MEKSFYNSLDEIEFSLKDETVYYNGFKECVERDIRGDTLNLVLKVFYEEVEEYSNSEGLYVLIDNSDIKKDIYVDRNYYKRIYGLAIDSNDIPYRDVLIRFFRYKVQNGKLNRDEIDKMFTNNFGEFNFVILNPDNDYEYKVEIDSFYKF
ncbi:MAG: hypothetical protein ACRC57_13905 [Sarcina sp.]